MQWKQKTPQMQQTKWTSSLLLINLSVKSSLGLDVFVWTFWMHLVPYNYLIQFPTFRDNEIIIAYIVSLSKSNKIIRTHSSVPLILTFMRSIRLKKDDYSRTVWWHSVQLSNPIHLTKYVVTNTHIMKELNVCGRRGTRKTWLAVQLE